MRVFVQKLRHVYFPLLAWAAGFAAAYSLLAWALVYRAGLLQLDDSLTTYWIPVALPWIVVLIWIRPRLRILNLEGGNGRARGLYVLAAGATIIAPTVLGQFYLSKASARVTRVAGMADVGKAPRSRYYLVDSAGADRVCLRREGLGFAWSSALVGRDGHRLRLTLTVALPICPAPGGVSDGPPPAWLGIELSDTVHPSAPDDMKEFTARELARKAESELAAIEGGGFTYLELVGPGEERRAFQAAIQKREPAGREHVVVQPRHDAFEDRAGSFGRWALTSFVAGAAAWLVLLAFPGINRKKLRELADGRAAERRRTATHDLLVAFRTWAGTTTLIGLNVLVFLAMAFSGHGVMGFSVDDLVALGASARPLLHGFGALRLATSQFVHGGLAHLIGNLYGLFLGGSLLEAFVGSRRLLVAYFVAGTAGGLASALVHPASVSVGASGAVFGLFGVLFGLVATKDPRAAAARRLVLVGGGVYVGLNLLLAMKNAGVDNAAHIGGLVAGFVLAPLLGAPRRAASVQSARGDGERARPK